MKRYFNILSVIATASLLLASCSQLAPSKAEVEAGFSPLTPLPTLTIAGAPVCDALNGTVTVPVTVDGLSANAGVLEVGILSSTDPSFKSSKFKAVENPTSGTVNMVGAVTANTTYYIKAVASSPTGGTAYSDVITVDVPDIPLYAKAPGTYSGTVVSDAYGDEYTSTIYIVSDDEEPTKYVWIGGIEPYYAGKGETGKTFESNYVLASVDEENGCLVVALGADLHRTGGQMIAGLNSDHMETATNYAPLTFAMTKSGDLYRANAFMTLMSDGDAEDCYAGGVTYKRK
jgi:hypothetical protein